MRFPKNIEINLWLVCYAPQYPYPWSSPAGLDAGKTDYETFTELTSAIWWSVVGRHFA